MRQLFVLATIALSGCGEQASRDTAPTEKVKELVPADRRVSRPAQLIPLPKDQAEVDRLILLGYTPHADHLHLPGVESCPMSGGNEAVM